MAEISAKLVKELRDRTSAGMMECKKALVETNGDLEKAIDLLKEKGQSKLDKKANRIAAEGVIGSYIHSNNRIGVIVEINTETDFSAKTDQIKDFAKNIAMHIAAMNPKYVSESDVDKEELEREENVLRQQALNESNANMPEDKKEMIIQNKLKGRLKKWYSDFVLLDQPYVKDQDKTVDQYLRETVAAVGENVKIRRFARFEVGEGLEKKQENFAEEVQSQINSAK
ncbi:MAG: translation elongation factor Ts [Peptoniphilaceae bacterium]|nr:translation elongation factor Ts [Peptoniphilaceae bacterium]MDD7383142.1 translation elongation factor Ts [Peptoniphilaceae bacterium]MDY3738127.1 translation elongation factor Ts [Peptoniphilaceae bacterium]